MTPSRSPLALRQPEFMPARESAIIGAADMGLSIHLLGTCSAEADATARRGTGKTRLAEAFAAAVGPMVLVLDDIHWADSSSLALLRFVVSVLPDLPAVLMLTTRDDPLELSTAAADLLRANV